VAEEKRKGRPKLTLKDIREQHGLEIDPSDPLQRGRYRRILDLLFAAGVKLEDTNISDIARGSAVKAAIDYADRTGGKAVTPIEQTIVVHKSAEESAASILEMLGQKRKEAEQAQQPTNKRTTIQ
jgi:hypothetical protein